MADLGTAYIQIVPSTDGIKGKLTSAISSDVSSAGTSAGKSFGTGLTKKAAAVMAGAAGITAAAVAIGKKVVSVANETAEYGDVIDKTSQKIGMSASSYQKWDYVMNLAGTSMSSCTTGMKTLTNQIDEAKNGSESATGTFDKLGISVDDLNSMSREEAFSAVISGLQGMEDSTERAAIANDLFGKSGQNLTPLFNMTSEETQELMQNYEDLGGVMSDTAVKDSAAYEDAMTTLKATMTGLKNSAITPLLPVLTKLMTAVANGVGKLRNFASMVKDKVKPYTDQLKTAWTQLKTACQPITTAVGNLISKFTKSNDSQKNAQKVASALGTGIKVLSTIISKVATIVTNTITTFNKFKEGINSAKASVSSFASTVSSKFNGIKNSISSAMNSARSVVSNIFGRIKSIFSTSLKINLKVPHISVSGGKAPWGIGGKGTKPSFSVKWYKKAMDNAMVLSNATIFGYDGQSYLGGGEAGNEVVAGEQHLMDLIGNAVASQTSGIYSLLATYLPDCANTSIYLDGNQVAKSVENRIASKTQRRALANG